jgi:hypothetical protein
VREAALLHCVYACVILQIQTLLRFEADGGICCLLVTGWYWRNQDTLIVVGVHGAVRSGSEAVHLREASTREILPLDRSMRMDGTPNTSHHIQNSPISNVHLTTDKQLRSHRSALTRYSANGSIKAAPSRQTRLLQTRHFPALAPTSQQIIVPGNRDLKWCTDFGFQPPIHLHVGNKIPKNKWKPYLPTITLTPLLFNATCACSLLYTLLQLPIYTAHLSHATLYSLAFTFESRGPERTHSRILTTQRMQSPAFISEKA